MQQRPLWSVPGELLAPAWRAAALHLPPHVSPLAPLSLATFALLIARPEAQRLLRLRHVEPPRMSRHSTPLYFERRSPAWRRVPLGLVGTLLQVACAPVALLVTLLTWLALTLIRGQLRRAQRRAASSSSRLPSAQVVQTPSSRRPEAPP